jgi:hypothetical protein
MKVEQQASTKKYFLTRGKIIFTGGIWSPGLKAVMMLLLPHLVRSLTWHQNVADCARLVSILHIYTFSKVWIIEICLTGHYV